MKKLNWFFFYTYIGLVILAGFWGAFISPKFDFNLLFSLDIKSLSEFESVNLISQYRFLRAIELGFGLFSILFRKEIFSIRKFNNLFLFIMFSGVLARVFSLFSEGIPSRLFLFFFIYEFIGLIIIYIYSRSTIKCNGKA
jgi:hypothetical protein